MPALVLPPPPSPQQLQQQAQQRAAVDDRQAAAASRAKEDTEQAASSISPGAAAAAGNSNATAGALADEQDEAPDLTEQLLQQFQRQLEARSGGSAADGDRGRASSKAAASSWLPALPEGFVLVDNWRLLVLAVVGPAVLITALGQLLGRQGGEERQQEQQQGPALPAEGTQVPQAALPVAPPQATARVAQQGQQKPQPDPAAGKAEQKQRSFLAWLFPKAAEEAPDEQAAAPQPAGDMSLQQQQPAQQQAPPPPPLPPPPPPQAGAATGLADAGPAPGAVLWQRKAPAAAGADGTAGPATNSSILWQRGGPAVAATAASVAEQHAGREEQQPSPGEQRADATYLPGDGTGSSGLASSELDADSSSAGSSAEPAADLWRMPLEQLRSAGGSNGGAPAAVPAAVAEAASIAPAAAAEAVLQGAGEVGGTGAAASSSSEPSVQPSPLELAQSAASPAADAMTPAAEQDRQRGSSPTPARRQASPLDNAEPDGWLGRLQRMGRRRPTAAGWRDADM